MWRLWLIFALAFIILESVTQGFLVFWFAIGSLIAMIISFFTRNIVIQVTVFLISSIILIFATRKFANQFNKHDNSNTINNIIDKEGKVLTTIDPLNNEGQIKIGGETWSATSYNDQIIEKGTIVLVKEVDGVKAVVTPIEK